MPLIAPISYRMEIKRAVVRTLRQVFDADYPDSQLRNIFISIEHPQVPEQYPAIFVTYNETELRTAGVGHIEVGDPDEGEDGSLSQRRWMFKGNVGIEIFGLTSQDRDYLADHFVNMFAYSAISIYTAPFIPGIVTSPNVDIQMNLDSLAPGGEETVSQVSWGSADQRIYKVSYSFGVFGSFTSGHVISTYIQRITASASVSP